MNKLKVKLMIVINEGGKSEEILDIESQIKELVDEDVIMALKNREKLQHSWGWETKEGIP